MAAQACQKRGNLERATGSKRRSIGGRALAGGGWGRARPFPIRMRYHLKQFDFETLAPALTAQANYADAYAATSHMPTHGLQSIFKSKMP